MLLLDGKATAQTVREELKKTIATATSGGQRPPGLAVILAGEDPASQVYVRNKEFACTHVGIFVETCRLPESVTEAEVVRCIDRFNKRSDIDGILVQLPLPKHIRPSVCLLAIDPAKDVDGFHPENAGKLTLGLPGLRPCTPQGIIELLRRYGLSPRGKKAVVVGRSNIVGKPLAILLAEPLEYANATVTICHSETRHLANECRQADFLFLAVGKPQFCTASMVKEGSVVIDVGINRTPAGLCGDADFEGLKDHVSAITPVPGGIGPMTVAMLLKNTVEAWQGRTSASLTKEKEILAWHADRNRRKRGMRAVTKGYLVFILPKKVAMLPLLPALCSEEASVSNMAVIHFDLRPVSRSECINRKSQRGIFHVSQCKERRLLYDWQGEPLSAGGCS